MSGPSVKTWSRILDRIENATPSWARKDLGRYFAKRYDLRNWQKNRLAFRAILNIPVPDCPPLYSGKTDYKTFNDGRRFLQYVPTGEYLYEADEYSLTAPLIWLAHRPAGIWFMDNGKYKYQATVPDKMTYAYLELTPVDHDVPASDEFVEVCEALLHLNYRKWSEIESLADELEPHYPEAK